MTKLAFLPVVFVLAACSSTSAGGPAGALDAGSEASADTSDAGADAGLDAGADAGLDAASEAAVDAAPRAGLDAGDSGACAALPSQAQKQGSGCTGQSGTFTEVTFDSFAGTYSEACGVTPYTSQADFDANEGTSTQSGTTIMSHEDYVVTSSCASGSIDYQTSGTAKSTILFIWTKIP